MKKLLTFVVALLFFVIQPEEVNAQTVSSNVAAGNWYRIASNPGNRANAAFTLRDFISSGGHSTLEFRAGISYNYKEGISFTVQNHSFYYNPTFIKVRILSKSTYEPQYLEVYVNRSGSVNYSIYDNLQSSGWVSENWTAGSIPSGYISTEFEVNHLFVVGSVGNGLTVNRNGNVGIGATNTGSYKLAVEGKIGAREVKVQTTSWADFVFADDYVLPPLAQVELFIKENKHLPEIPSEAEVKENGIELGVMNAKLLQKVEELTLYMIALKKENEELKEKSKTTEQRLLILESQR